jgi:hypothetical protein
MNNFWVLHQGIVINNKQIFFHNDPQLSVIDGEEHFNFDFMISDGTLKINEIAAERILPPHMVFVNRRYSKTEQAMRINNYVKRTAGRLQFNDDDFVKIKSWVHSQALGLSSLVNPSGKVVIKPNDGARGIGQFLVDTDKIPFAVMIEALDKYIKGMSTSKELFEELNKYDPDMAYSTRGEHHVDEGLSGLKTQGYSIQSFVDNIESEYRIITGAQSEIAYVQKRNVYNADGFPQASGSNTNSILGEDIVSIESVLSSKQIHDLSALARDVIGPLSSLDLFVTKDKKWGVFEYCNQFGIKGVPANTVANLHKQFISNIINDLFGTERYLTPSGVKDLCAAVT